MLNITLGGRSRNCTGVTRRDVLKVGALTAGGLTLADTLAARAAAAQIGQSRDDRAVICFWLDGGPTHHETWDPKPNAPAEYKGPFGAISTNVPGVQIGQWFPQTAQLMDKLAIVRSVHHDNGDHFAAAHWMWTGYHGSNASNQDPMFPSCGSIIAKNRGPNRPGVPPYVAIPYAATIGLRPGYQSGAFLGVTHNPFDVDSDPNSANFQVRNLNLPGGVDGGRTIDRKALLAGLDRARRQADASGLMDGMDRFNIQALDLVSSGAAQKAFDVNLEDPRLRDRYGRNSVGQGALLARRLVEAGVTFVSVHSGGWDNHSNIEGAMKGHGPRMDAAISSLVDDLVQRGLYDQVLILVMGEFGRTPKVNGSAGRDHWGNVMSVLLGGGGLKGGQVVGASDEQGAKPIQRPVKPAHILHTVYKLVGIDAGQTNVNRAGRPIHVLGEGEPLGELV